MDAAPCGAIRSRLIFEGTLALGMPAKSVLEKRNGLLCQALLYIRYEHLSSPSQGNPQTNFTFEAKVLTDAVVSQSTLEENQLSLTMMMNDPGRTQRKQRFLWPESNLGPSFYEADVYPISSFRHGLRGLENSDDNQSIRHEKNGVALRAV